MHEIFKEEKVYLVLQQLIIAKYPSISDDELQKQTQKRLDGVKRAFEKGITATLKGDFNGIDLDFRCDESIENVDDAAKFFCWLLGSQAETLRKERDERGVV